MSKRFNDGLTINQQKAIVLLVSKDQHGMTNHEIASEVGVSPQAMYKWLRNDERFIEELSKEAEKVMDAFVIEIYGTLQDIIRDEKETTSNKLQAIDKVFKIKGKYIDRQSIEFEQKQINTESQDERQQRILQMEQDLLG